MTANTILMILPTYRGLICRSMRHATIDIWYHCTDWYHMALIQTRLCTDGTNLWLYVGWHVENLHGNKVGLYYVFNMIFLNLSTISYKVLAMLTQLYAEYIFTTMVISCVAYGFTNRVGKGCDISFHRHVLMLKDQNRIDSKIDLNMLYLQTGIIYSCHGLNIFKSDFYWRMKVYW